MQQSITCQGTHAKRHMTHLRDTCQKIKIINLPWDTLKMIHLGAEKMISSKTVIELYFKSAETQKELHDYHKSLNLEGLRKGTVKFSQPVTVGLNDHTTNVGMRLYYKHKENTTRIQQADIVC